MAHFCAEDFKDGRTDTAVAKKSESVSVQHGGSNAASGDASDERGTGTNQSQEYSDSEPDGSSDVSADTDLKDRTNRASIQPSSKRHQGSTSRKKQ
ncbi:hypothetical protein U5B43_10000 [Campylobacter sp. 9BO]|uniref:hypothetical protein n=1 Tax=Campylobacter sp. 9BO TaxID=3424759 RepID=UPI003D32DC58